MSSRRGFDRLEADPEVSAAVKGTLLTKSLNSPQSEAFRIESLLDITQDLDLLVLLEHKWHLSASVDNKQANDEPALEPTKKLQSRLKYLTATVAPLDPR